MKKLITLAFLLSMFLVGVAFSASERKTITAANMYTDSIVVPAGTSFNISIRDITGTMTIRLFRQFRESGDSGWGEVDYWDVTSGMNDKEYISDSPEPEDVWVRIGCPVGDYTSGNATVRIGFK